MGGMLTPVRRHTPTHADGRPVKITFGEMRQGRGGTRHILIYCNDCGHSGTMSADQWRDDMRLSDIEVRLVCRACGRRGAQVRPLFGPARMGTAQ